MSSTERSFGDESHLSIATSEYYTFRASLLEQRLTTGGLAELTLIPQWIVWRRTYLPEQNRVGKIPHSPITQQIATNDDPRTCMATFEDAIAMFRTGRFDGVGFVFTESDPYTGNDFDNCIEDGKIVGLAARAVSLLNSYTEISDSGSGIHIITKNSPLPQNLEVKRPNSNGKVEVVEMHDRAYFYNITGDHVEGTPLTINERSQEQTDWYNENAVFPNYYTPF